MWRDSCFGTSKYKFRNLYFLHTMPQSSEWTILDRISVDELFDQSKHSDLNNSGLPIQSSDTFFSDLK